MARFVVGVLLILLFSFTASAQNPPQSDPQAVSLATQAMAALTNGVAVSDVTLTGNITWIAGSDNDTGSATLLAKGTGESRVELRLTSGQRSEIRNNASGPQGAWIDLAGSTHAYAFHNCWTDAAWFYPALSSLSAADPSIVLVYVGQESRAGKAVQHIRSYRYVPAKNARIPALTQQLSTMEFYLDATSLLPVAITFSVHPDDDVGTSIPTEVRFSGYQLSNGVRVPLHVQKYLNGGLVLDIAVSTVSLNSGLPDSTFNIPLAPAQ